MELFWTFAGAGLLGLGVGAGLAMWFGNFPDIPPLINIETHNYYDDEEEE